MKHITYLHHTTTLQVDTISGTYVILFVSVSILLENRNQRNNLFKVLNKGVKLATFPPEFSEYPLYGDTNWCIVSVLTAAFFIDHILRRKHNTIYCLSLPAYTTISYYIHCWILKQLFQKIIYAAQFNCFMSQRLQTMNHVFWLTFCLLYILYNMT